MAAVAKKIAKEAKSQGGKRLYEARKAVNVLKIYDLDEAVNLVKSSAKAKFDETVELAFMLGVDPRHSDQMVRGTVVMPNGIGKEVRVAVFAREDKADEAKKAGADIVGTDDLVDEIQNGNINFDRCIATPDMMSVVGKVAKILGPRGLMPNPKMGTVTPNPAKAVEEAKSGLIEFKVDKNAGIHSGVAKVSFEANAIIENIRAFVGALQQAKPSAVKGTYIKSASISSTMGVGVKLDVQKLIASL